MIKHKLFAKGETIHALISTTQNPNILFPVRATIYDVKFDDINPQYQIRIKKLYDNIYFLKHYMFGGRFIKDFDNKDTKINIKREGYSSTKQVEDELFNGIKFKQYLLTVDSVFCVKTRDEQIQLFNNINTFHIQMKLKELYELTNRSTYSKGQFYFHTKGEYIKSIEKFLGERYPKDNNWAEDLLNRPESSEMDGAEWV
ncbi:hypothetical protein OAC86_00235 [bacterium]|jgi:hypothetical protein|nr:hypothetical protein [bacterium]MDB9899952.1 hypothetical protein [bacterium]|tara:strand:+ start:45 stop:644 length:600 start_codon:yes stop_codon:yes gene_type:complete